MISISASTELRKYVTWTTKTLNALQKFEKEIWIYRSFSYVQLSLSLTKMMSRAEGMTDTSFLIANAQIVGFPIVYVSDHFSRLVGHRCLDFRLKLKFFDQRIKLKWQLSFEPQPSLFCVPFLEKWAKTLLKNVSIFGRHERWKSASKVCTGNILWE